MPKPKILLTRRWPDAVEARLAADYDVTRNDTDEPLDAAALAQAMRDHDALCPTVTDKLPRDVILAEGRRARVIGNYGAGFEHIDLDAAREGGIVVTNTPDVLTDATADIAMTLILMTTRRAGEGERELRAGDWAGWRPTHLLGRSLRGKTLGLIGYGRIAGAVAGRATAFGMKVIVHSRSRAADVPEADYHPTLDGLLRVADVVSLHAPGGTATRHMIDAAALRSMKRDAVLINAGRGSLIDEAALADALREGVIAAAGLDVYAQEPAIDASLIDLPNVVLLPHLGSATLETREAMGMRVADNLDAFFAGQASHDRIA